MSAAAFAAAAMAMPMPMPVTPGTTVDMVGHRFTPSHLQVLVGDTVTFRNGDHAIHAVSATEGSFASPRMSMGDDYAVTFTEPGDHPYYCPLHASMRGMVHVDALALIGPTGTLRPGATAQLSVVAPAGTAEVTLHRVTSGGEELVATAAADADGRASFAVPVDGPGRLRARAGELASAVTDVRVAPRVRAVVERAGRAVSVRATVAPAIPGATVRLERYVPLRFAYVGVRTARLGADGRIGFSVRDPRRTTYRVSVVKAPGGWAPSGSGRAVVVRHGHH